MFEGIVKNIIEILKFSIDLFKNRSKGVNNYKSTIDIIEKECDTNSYYRDLASSYFIENDFYMKTGIQTNINSIEKYYRFKNKLGRNYTWISIKLVKPHLNLDGDEISITLTKVEKVYSKIISFSSFFLMLISIGVMLYIGNIKTHDVWYMNALFKITATVIPASIGISFLYGTMSIQTAKRMIRDLNKSKINKEDKNDFGNKST